jgi:hypothetical protein
MCAIDFRQIKLRSCPNISWYVLVPLILKVDVSMLLELQGDVSAPLVLKNCFSTSRTVGPVAQSV